MLVCLLHLLKALEFCEWLGIKEYLTGVEYELWVASRNVGVRNKVLECPVLDNVIAVLIGLGFGKRIDADTPYSGG